MFALFIALSVAAPSAAEIDAALDQLRSNAVLMESLVDHAFPLTDCTLKRLRGTVPTTSNSTKADQEFEAFTKQMGLAAEQCGSKKEHEFWTAAVNAAYPRLNDDVAKLIAASALSFIIFDIVVKSGN